MIRACKCCGRLRRAPDRAPWYGEQPIYAVCAFALPVVFLIYLAARMCA